MSVISSVTYLAIFRSTHKTKMMEESTTKTKIFFIDNLRVLMTVLVILHHTVITYGGPGGWYFTDPTTNKPALIIMTLFVATNQAFFMGFFFFLSALFTESSYNKKGTAKFIADRLKRLGIPLLFYSFILGPIMNYLVYRYGLHKDASFMQYIGGYDNWIDPGVMWFVAALLLFTGICILLKQFNKNKKYNQYALPGNRTILIFAIALGVISYLVRIVFPVGWVLHPVGFQLAHFPQYSCMFLLGIMASRNGWMNYIGYSTGKRWLIVALVLVFVVFPLMFILINSPIDTFQGHGTWQSFFAAIWEQLTGVSIMVALSGIAKHKWNYTTPLLQKMSRAAFAAYIFHPLIVITISLSLLQWHVDPAIKLLIAAPCAVLFSFCFAWVITKLPVAKNIV
ncbi:acyltransferase [soil metagenome]